MEVCRQGAPYFGTDGLIMPFEAVNLKAVDVTILKFMKETCSNFTGQRPGEGIPSCEGSPPLCSEESFAEEIPLRTLEWNRFTLDLSS